MHAVLGLGRFFLGTNLIRSKLERTSPGVQAGRSWTEDEIPFQMCFKDVSNVFCGQNKFQAMFRKRRFPQIFELIEPSHMSNVIHQVLQTLSDDSLKRELLIASKLEVPIAHFEFH